MKKKLSVVLLALVCLFSAAIGFTACSVDDYVGVTVKNVTLEEGDSKELSVKFTGVSEQDIVYEYEGNAIGIVNGVVTAYVGGTKTEVKATTVDGEYSTEFTVTVVKTYANDHAFTVKNVELFMGEKANIELVYTNPDCKDPIKEVSFEGENISVAKVGDNYVITPLVADTVTEVVVRTDRKAAKFNVTVKERGTMTIANMVMRKGSSQTIKPVFSNPSLAELVKYSFEGNAIVINSGIVMAVNEGTVTVTATSKNYTTTFTVTVIDFGTLMLDDIKIYVGQTANIVPVFSITERAEELTYTVSGSAISLEGNVITAVKAGKATVTARSEHFTETFTVTVCDVIDYDSAIVFTDYMVTLYPNVIGNANVTLTTTNTDIVSIDGMNVKGLKAGTATVTVSNGTLSKDVTVTVKTHGMPTDDSITSPRPLSTEDDRLNAVKSGLAGFSHDEGELVLFAGDSFMDERWFITDFYTTRFGTKNAYTTGISSSRASAWIFIMQNFYDYQPKAIVLHIGTNDLFDGKLDPNVVIRDLKTLLSMSHDNMPETEIYWWTIEQRINESSYNGKIKQVNSAITEWAEDKDWLKVINTYDAMSNGDGTPNQSLYGDSVHPACPNGYNVLLNRTYRAGLTITENTSAGKIGNWSTKKSDGVAASAKSIPLSQGNYLLHTELTLGEYNNNAHIAFTFDNDNNRLLLWNSGNNGIFNYGGACNGGYQGSSIDSLNVKGGKNTVAIDILAYDGNVYWFADGVLERVFVKVPAYDALRIGTEGVAVTFKNTEIFCEKNDGMAKVNEKKNDPQIAALFGGSQDDGIVLGSSTSLPSLNNQALIDARGYLAVTSAGVELNGGSRDRFFIINGNATVSGDFAFSFDFERTSPNVGGFLGLTFSKVGQHGVWGQYHLFYQNDGDTTFKVHSDYGSQAPNPKYTGISPEVKTMTCYIVRNGNTVKQVYYINNHYAVATSTFTEDLELWINIEAMTGKITNVSFTTNKQQVVGIMNSIICGDVGHDWDKGTITQEPTETEAGNKHYVCNRCGETKDEEYTCDHVFESVVWTYNADVPTLTLTCAKDSTHVATFTGEAVTQVITKKDGKWGVESTVNYGGTKYQDFKAYETIYQNLVIGASENASKARRLNTVNGQYLFSATVAVTGVQKANNVHLIFGKDMGLDRLLVWSNNNEVDLSISGFSYVNVEGKSVKVTDGAANFTVKLIVSNYKMFFYVNDELVLSYKSTGANQVLMNWNTLLIGAEGGATWNFSNVVFESKDGANYKAAIAAITGNKQTLTAGTKKALTAINAEWANAQYAEVTIYEPYGNMVINDGGKHTVGIQLGVRDANGSETYGFGSWHYGSIARYLLAWQQSETSGTDHNDQMWQWLDDWGFNHYGEFADYNKGVKIAVAIIDGKLYSFWSVDDGATWNVFAQNGGAQNNINANVASPQCISYIYCGVDGAYSGLNASATVPENIKALVK